MDHSAYDDKYISAILCETKTIAVVGASAKTIRPSYLVVKYLISKGYDVIPVNPGQAGGKICGAKVHASLADIDRPVDMVDVFRNSDAALGVVKEALMLDPLPKVIWMQLTVFNQEAATLAEEAGIHVVMDRCPKIEYARLAREIGWSGVCSGVVSSKKPKLLQGFQKLGVMQK